MMEELAKLLTVQNGLLVTILGGAFAYFTRILNRLEVNLRQDMASMETRANSRFDRLEANVNDLRKDVHKIDIRVAQIEVLITGKLDVKPSGYPLDPTGGSNQQEAQAGVGEPSPDDSKNPPTLEGKGEVQ